MTQPSNRRLATEAYVDALTAADVGAQPAGDYATSTDLSTGLAVKVNSSTYTAGLAAKQDTATLPADVAAHVADGSALDTALRAAYESHVDRTGAATNDLPTLQGDGTLAFQSLTDLIDTTPITAADFDLAVPQGARAYADTTGQTITNGSYPTYLDLNTQEFNENSSLYSIDLTNNKITVAEGGLFLVSWDISYADAAGLREAYIAKNGGNAILSAAAGAGGQTGRTAPIRLAANDYVQVICYVEGADVGLITSAPHRCGLGLYRIAL